MNKIYKILILGILILIYSMVNADIRVSENPTINTPDLIYNNISQLLELNQQDHREALSTIFGVYAEIDQNVLNTMLEEEFSRINEAVNNVSGKFVDEENLHSIDDNDPSLVLLRNSLQQIQSLGEFNVLLIEVGAVSDGLKHLNTIFQKQMEILQLLQENTTIEEQNTIQYSTQGARLISEKIQGIIVPQQKEILQYLDNNTNDPDIAAFISEKSNTLQTIFIIGD